MTFGLSQDSNLEPPVAPVLETGDFCDFVAYSVNPQEARALIAKAWSVFLGSPVLETGDFSDFAAGAARRPVSTAPLRPRASARGRRARSREVGPLRPKWLRGVVGMAFGHRAHRHRPARLEQVKSMRLYGREAELRGHRLQAGLTGPPSSVHRQ